MNNIWHNSNEEQPTNLGDRIIVVHDEDGYGDINKYVSILPNHRWAYLEDLDPEYVECGNCVNDKGCIVCEHGEQKQILAKEEKK